MIVYGPRPDGRGGFSYANAPALTTRRSPPTSPAAARSRRTRRPSCWPSPPPTTTALTWSAPVIGTVKKNPNDFNDKEAIWVDDLPASPYFGRVYLTWTEFRSALAVAVRAGDGRRLGRRRRELLVAQATLAGRQQLYRQRPPGLGRPQRPRRQRLRRLRAGGGAGGRHLARRRQDVVAPDHDRPGRRHRRPDPRLQLPDEQLPQHRRRPARRQRDPLRRLGDAHAGGGRIVVATSTDKGQTWGRADDGQHGRRGLRLLPGARRGAQRPRRPRLPSPDRRRIPAPLGPATRRSRRGT